MARIWWGVAVSVGNEGGVVETLETQSVKNETEE
jgi:hypothetical protein